MFRVKICGITCAADALAARAAGADAIGLNFYSASPRAVPEALAHEIAASLPGGLAKVGLFVNASADAIRRVCSATPLDLVQLHGDETPEFLAELAPLRIVRAFRWGERGWNEVADYVAACRALGAAPAAMLIDAHVRGMFGGTGQTLPWHLLRERPAELASVPLILAGGLTAENVAEAVTAVRPAGVDTASGVEISPGRKDREKLARFVKAARRALDLAATGSTPRGEE